MIRDTTRSPGTDEHPTYRRRRSVSRVPASKWNLAAAERAFEAGRRRHAEEQHQEERQQHQQHQQQSKSTQKRGDPLAALAVMPKPVKPSRLHPSLRRFMSGRSSLWAVAMALHDRHHRRRALKARMAQSCLWAANIFYGQSSSSSREACVTADPLGYHTLHARARFCSLLVGVRSLGALTRKDRAVARVISHG